MTVSQRQALLFYLGYYPGPVDGDWGKASRAGCVKFQSDYGLTADGIGGPVTDKALIGAVAGTVVPVRNTQNGQETEDLPEWWKDIRYFKRSEFKCKCGGRFCKGYPAEMQEAVVKIADTAREHFGKPAHVISGLRCKQWNAHEGGVANSQHMYGEAIDLKITGVSGEELLSFLQGYPGVRYAYKINSTNVHFDINKVGR